MTAIPLADLAGLIAGGCLSSIGDVDQLCRRLHADAVDERVHRADWPADVDPIRCCASGAPAILPQRRLVHVVDVRDGRLLPPPTREDTP